MRLVCLLLCSSVCIFPFVFLFLFLPVCVWFCLAANVSLSRSLSVSVCFYLCKCPIGIHEVVIDSRVCSSLRLWTSCFLSCICLRGVLQLI